MDWAFPGSTGLWQAAWAAIPVALVVALLCRLLPCRPATRHSLWIAALLALVVPLILPNAWRIEIPTDWLAASLTSFASSDAANLEASRASHSPADATA